MIVISFQLKPRREVGTMFRLVVLDSGKPLGIEVLTRDNRGTDSWRPASNLPSMTAWHVLAAALEQSTKLPWTREPDGSWSRMLAEVEL